MALAVVIRPLSGAVDGLPIQVSATTGSATVIHTGQSNTLVFERLYLWATNSTTNAVSTIMEWGPSTNQILDEIPPRAGAYPLVQGLYLLGRSGSLTVIKMGASASAIIYIFGYVDRVTES